MSTSSDRREFDQYLKFFVLKSIQIIVQSRKGERLRTTSTNASTWFSLALPEDRSVVSELRKASSNRVPQPGAPHCVEISLKSTESIGDDSSIMVEVWTMSIDPSTTDPLAKATSVVYPRMSVALKSLLALTRVLPAHRLSSHLDEDWTLCYRIFHGSPDSANLGPGVTTASIAHVNTPYGRLCINVAYRRRIDLLQSSPDGEVSFVPSQGQDLRTSSGKASPHLARPWPQPKTAPFTSHQMFNDEEVTSLAVQEFSHLMSYQRVTSLTPSLHTQGSSGSNQGDISDTSSTPQSRQMHMQAQEDFVMLDQAVKPIFAPEPPASDDLSQFFEECRNPPSLDMFSSGNVMDVNAALMEDLST